MTDRELLEAAAKAAGVPIMYHTYMTTPVICTGNERDGDAVIRWNPLTDDGDALRLAVRLNIPVYPYDDETSTGTVGVVAKNWGNREENTRRAIVRAAAEIGRTMK